jgi:hypothetical protein
LADHLTTSHLYGDGGDFKRLPPESPVQAGLFSLRQRMMLAFFINDHPDDLCNGKQHKNDV